MPRAGNEGAFHLPFLVCRQRGYLLSSSLIGTRRVLVHLRKAAPVFQILRWIACTTDSVMITMMYLTVHAGVSDQWRRFVQHAGINKFKIRTTNRTCFVSGQHRTQMSKYTPGDYCFVRADLCGKKNPFKNHKEMWYVVLCCVIILCVWMRVYSSSPSLHFFLTAFGMCETSCQLITDMDFPMNSLTFSSEKIAAYRLWRERLQYKCCKICACKMGSQMKIFKNKQISSEWRYM